MKHTSFKDLRVSKGGLKKCLALKAKLIRIGKPEWKLNRLIMINFKTLNLTSLTGRQVRRIKTLMRAL